MRRFYLFGCALLCGTLAFGQSQKPADLVAQNQGKFKNTSFISQASQTRQDASTVDLEESMVLDINFEALKELRSSPSQAFRVDVPSAAHGLLQLELVQVDLFREDYTLTEEPSGQVLELDNGQHYRGVIAGNEGSLVAFSIFEDEIAGFISAQNMAGNLVIGKTKGDRATADHVIYRDTEIAHQMGKMCHVEDTGRPYTAEELAPTDTRALSDCVGLFMEIDYNVTQALGGTSAAANNYLTTLFNGISTLMANESINTVLSASVVWTSTSPYSGSNASARLSSFQSQRNNFNGDLANLITNINFGGVAATIDGVCASENNRMCVSGVVMDISNVPTYSFDVEVSTHEYGHLFGSFHTHGCYWNGNGTQIDDCGNFLQANQGSTPEGNSCYNGNNPQFPSNGGTVMSYCYGVGGVGINFSNGFGTQPGNAIRNVIATANCLSSCGGGGGGGCDDNSFTLNLTTDNYPAETSWSITNEGGSTVASGGSYSNANSNFSESICLPDGCYTFTINDSYGDGICCAYGNGSYSLVGPEGEAASGGSFTSSDATEFCIGGSGGGGGGCVTIDFNANPVSAYGGNQDNGTSAVLSGGTTLRINNNAWKALTLNYTVTPNTQIAFDFGSTTQGEIHGIGFDNNDGISNNFTFQLYGTQNWGNRNYDYTSVGNWQSFVIPVGQVYTGSFDRLFFTCDHDGGASNGNSYYRNVRIYEGSNCSGYAAAFANNDILGSEETFEQYNFSVYPNPAQDQLSIAFETLQSGQVDVKMFSTVGQLVKNIAISATEGNNVQTLSLDGLAPGIYLLKATIEGKEMIQRIKVAN